MLCSLRKWQISKSFDTGKPLSQALAEHINTCTRCREFFRLGTALQQMPPAVFVPPSSADLSHLPQKIMASLDTHPVPKKPGRKKPFLIPALTSAAALTAILLAVLVLIPSPSVDLKSLNPLSQWEAAQSTVSSLWQNVQSPYQTEWESLKNSLNSTAVFFLNFVDLPASTQE